MLESYLQYSPAQLRALFRNESLVLPTAGLCPDYVQANLAILPGAYAEDFAEFIRKNPKPCPLLEVITGDVPISKTIAPGSDITRDFPLYRVYRHGEPQEDIPDGSHLWTPDMAAFMIGCSLTFEASLVRGGIPLKHYEQNKRVPMYNTDIPCVPSALFYGNYVVSMRPVKRELVPLAVSITEKMDYAHGAPVQLGNPEEIGIFDIEHPDYGDPLEIADDEIPVFWACGVTAQAAAQQTKPEIMISHSPGYMLITDIRISDLSK